MTRCPACGQIVESKRDKLAANVATWTFLTVIVWGITLSLAQWTVAWWSERRDLVIMFAAISVVAGYYWIQYLRERSKK